MAERVPHARLIGRERARAEALFSSIGDGIIAMDEHGYVSDINEAALKILNCRPQDVINQWFPRAVKALDDEGKPIPPMERAVSQALLTGKSVSGKMFYQTNEGPVAVAITVAPILINKRPVGAIEVFRDVSQEHEIDKMKSEFISIASHQLRTPLTAIKTYSHMLASGYGGKLSKDQSEFMDIILSSIDRMNSLINTLLDISRIEQGRLSMSPQVINLEEIMEDVLTELMPLAQAKDIDVTLQYATDNLQATTDPLLIKEICLNLLSNAIKYTPEHGAVVINIAGTKRQLVFSIQDTGYGIPKSEQNRIFTKFFRAENVLDKDTSGTGLGLYLVKQLAESLGGEVAFTSTEGKGTCFTFKVPRQT